uniref:Arp2/3 complex 34 kDa subunit n=1 Tax=Cebus imitator TaxID=2715852 RepID=A0A2K5Q3W0_CEBIM
MYVESEKDRVTVVLSTVFKDDDDVVIGKLFMQEFKEGRKGLFSHREPPLELKDTDAAVGDNTGYITFVLVPATLWLLWNSQEAPRTVTGKLKGFLVYLFIVANVWNFPKCVR